MSRVEERRALMEKRKKEIAANVAKAKELKATGMNIFEIAEEMKVAASTVHYWLKLNND